MAHGPFFDQFIDEYYAECDEHLATIRRVVLEIEDLAADAAVPAAWLHELQRALHTLKGLSGMVGLTSAERVAHALEDVLRAAAPATARVDSHVVELLFDGARLFEACLSAHRLGTAAPELDGFLRAVGLVAQVAPAREHDRGEERPAGAGAVALSQPAVALVPGGDENRDVYRFEFAPSPDIAARGITVDVVRRRLQELGELLTAAPRITANAGIVFEFRVAVPPGRTPDEAWRGDRLSWALETDGEPEADAGGGAPDDAVVHEPAARGRGGSVVRVDLARLEELMRAVGDLVVSRSRLTQSLRRGAGQAGVDAVVWEELAETNAAMERQLRVLRENVMRIRLVRVGEVFERLRYAVRDVARESGRTVAIVVEGQDTEIDKAVVDRVLEPLLHLVRNAVSHGIEPPGVRLARGKRAEGRIALRAAAAGDRIVVRVEDDGGGIDRRAVADRARAMGLVVGDVNDDAALLDVICTPGFSTRGDADMASGRGVGMEVVRSTIRELGGELAVATGAAGTSFTIELPFTLMIVDALLVDVAGQQMAVPQPALREILQVEAREITALEHNEIVSYHGRVLPLVSLRRLFGMPESRASSVYVLVVGSEPQLAGLVVDRVLALREIVVHPVTDPLVAMPGVGGATELGDGRVSLILDAGALLRLAMARPGRALERRAALLATGS